MGQAKTRGTFEDRKAQAIEREQRAEEARLEAERRRIAEMTVEQRQAEARRKAHGDAWLVIAALSGYCRLRGA